MIFLLSEIMPSCSYCEEKKLVYITIVAFFSRQPSSYIKYTKLNMCLSYNIKSRPSKSDSAPVRGDGYEPGLRSSDLEPTQRRRTACWWAWWWLYASWGVVKSFYMGW